MSLTCRTHATLEFGVSTPLGWVVDTTRIGGVENPSRMGTSQTQTAVYDDKICIIYTNEKTWNFWCGVLRMHSLQRTSYQEFLHQDFT